MNLLPKELKTFLEDFKKTNRKILNSINEITDLNFNGETNNVFKIDFTQININETFSFFIIISDLDIVFQEPSGIFSLNISTKDTNSIIQEYGSIYTGRFENGRFQNRQKITTSIKISKPVSILIKINSKKPVSSVFNVGITIV